MSSLKNLRKQWHESKRKYAAANTMYADLCKNFSDSDILEAAYLVYFADEDYEGDGKIWRVMHS